MTILRKGYWPNLNLVDICKTALDEGQNRLEEADSLSFLPSAVVVELECYEGERKEVEDIRKFGKIALR